MPWPKQLDRFPLFTIERLSTAGQWVRCEGLITNSAPPPEPGRHIFLATDPPDAIYGDVLSVDPATRRVVLQVQEDAHLSVGKSYPLLNAYHNAYVVRTVLDESKCWIRKRFSPRDAIATSGPDGFRRLTPVGEQGGHTARFYPLQENGEPPGAVIPAGWDHEHCMICEATISPHAEPEGYVDQEGNWVCCGCFEAYVAPHDLGFTQ